MADASVIAYKSVAACFEWLDQDEGLGGSQIIPTIGSETPLQ